MGAASPSDPDGYRRRHRARLRERFLNGGLEGFSERERLEFLLTLAIPRRDVKPLASALLERFGSFSAAIDAPPERLREVPGVGEVSLAAIKLVRAAAEQYLKDRADRGPALSSPDEVIRYLRAAMKGVRNEQFRVIFLDNRNRVIGIKTLHEGTVDQTAVYPRWVMEEALRYSAAAIVAVHNHPSGQLLPSEADRQLTRSLVDAAKILDLRFLDHIIIGEDGEGFFSFAQAGLLSGPGIAAIRGSAPLRRRASGADRG